MENRRQRKKKVGNVLDKEAEQVLQEAEILARWNKRPFYVS